MRRKVSKTFIKAGQRNLAIGRLKGIHNNLRTNYQYLSEYLTSEEAIALHDAHKLIMEVSSGLEARYFGKELT